MIGIESKKPSLTGEVFHDDFHHGDISVKEMRERKIWQGDERQEKLSFFHPCMFKIWLTIAMIEVSLFKPFLSYIWDPCSSCNNISGQDRKSVV